MSYHPVSIACTYLVYIESFQSQLQSTEFSFLIVLFDKFPSAIPAVPIGSKPGNTLRKKLDAISIAGFAAIELSFPDILSFGKLHLEHEVSPTNYDELCIVAAEIRRL